VLSAIGFTSADALLLQVTTGYLGGAGFNGVALDGMGWYLAFAAASLLLDVFFVLVIWSLWVPLLKWLRRSDAEIFAFAAATTLAVAVWMNFVRYRIHEIVGGMVHADVVWELAGGSAAAIAASVTPDLLSRAILLGIIVAHAAVALVAARLIERRWAEALGPLEPPPTRSIWAGVLVAGLAVLALEIAPASRGFEMIRGGLDPKPGQAVFSRLAEWATDFDFDGSGLVEPPRDPAPFDSTVSPYAVDWPGNGVDEDALAGDLPLDFAGATPVPVPEPGALPAPRRPHFLLIYLESFRADLVGRRRGDQEVTPFLNALARQGSASSRAYVTSPFTSRSRAQLFGGTLIPTPGQTTLIDDFTGRGYRTAHFSGQDDSFAGSEALLGTARADHFYDARQDVNRRTSRSTNSVSLQVSWKTLDERVLSYLAQTDRDRPLFLYVNIVDTHFPYSHEEIDDLLGVHPLDRSQIRRDQAERVVATYENAAANVDHAIEKVVTAFRAWAGDDEVALLVTADHGQALYEDGFLGHGAAVDDAQSRVPLIVWGIDGEWPEPIGNADLRGLLMRDLGRGARGAEARIRFVPDPGRALVQYFPRIDRPRDFALRRLARTTIFHFVDRRLEFVGPDEDYRHASDSAGAEEAALREVVWNWEALHLAEFEKVGPGPVPPGSDTAH